MTKAPYTQAPPTPVLSPNRTVAPTGHGRPYTAETIAVAMQDVPVSFPPQLRTEAMARTLAERIWTYDGQPYRRLSFDASCDEGGPPRCDLMMSGWPGFVPMEGSRDTYYWIVTGSGFDMLTPSEAEMRGYPTGLRRYPPELTPQLDALARSLDTGGQLADQRFYGAGWAIPPPDDAFILTYAPGQERGHARALRDPRPGEPADHDPRRQALSRFVARIDPPRGREARSWPLCSRLQDLVS